MTANRRITGRIGGLLGAILASLVAAAVYLFAPATGAQTPTTTKQNLVAYFVSWHVIARGSGGSQSSNKDGFIVESWTTKSEMKGTAITRFVDRGQGILSYWDTRFLAVKARKDLDFWREEHESYGDCFTHGWSALTDPDSYTGYDNHGNKRPSVFDTTKRQNGAVTDFISPFDNFGGMEFNEHHVLEAYGRNNCNYVKSFDMPHEFPDIGHLSNLPADDPNHPTSFHVHKHFSTDGSGATTGKPIEVEWTADAYLMGKCAERAGPIQEGDPVIQNEDVHIDADEGEISPDSKTRVHVKVTCDRVPIKDADVEATIEPVGESGGHYHVSKRLRGKLQGMDCGDLTNDKPCVTVNTDKDGDVIDHKKQKGLTFAPPSKIPSCRCVGLAGIYLVTAKSKRFPDRKDTVAITVRFADLTSKLVDDTDSGSGITVDQKRNNTIVGSYYDVRSATDAHPLGTWGKLSTVSAFQDLAKEFYQLQLDHNHNLHECKKEEWPLRKVSFNDIALPWGGLFDLGPSDKNPFHPWWQPGHQTHGKGEGGDFNHFYEQGSKQECNGSDRDFDTWLWGNLKALGEKRGGIWDQYDLDNGNLWHLHLDDAGVIGPSECPKDD